MLNQMNLSILCVQVLDNMVASSPEFCKILLLCQGDIAISDLSETMQSMANRLTSSTPYQEAKAVSDLLTICKFTLSNVRAGSLDAEVLQVGGNVGGVGCLQDAVTSGSQ